MLAAAVPTVDSTLPMVSHTLPPVVAVGDVAVGWLRLVTMPGT